MTEILIMLIIAIILIIKAGRLTKEMTLEKIMDLTKATTLLDKVLNLEAKENFFIKR